MNDSSNILLLILQVVYYIAIGVLAIFGLFGVYLLAAHGRSRILSLTVSLIYILFFLTMLGASEATLHSIV